MSHANELKLGGKTKTNTVEEKLINEISLSLDENYLTNVRNNIEISRDVQLQSCVKNLENSINCCNSSLKNKISVIYTNARSVVNKLDELQLYIEDEKPDIVGITESWTHSDIDDNEIALEGYQLFRKDRNREDKSKGGGSTLC